MKYCKICKTTAKESDTVCAKGHPLSVFGAATRAAPSVSPSGRTAPTKEPATPGVPPSNVMFTLLGEVQKLEEVQMKNRKRGLAFALLSLVLALAIVLILYQVYSSTVLSYAILENIEVEQDPALDWQIHISYDVKTPGKVAFDRQSGARRMEKLDLIGQTGRQGFTWTWPSDPKTGIDFHVRYRDGWFLNSHDRHFPVKTVERPGS